jgi:hypothetical protein
VLEGSSCALVILIEVGWRELSQKPRRMPSLGNRNSQMGLRCPECGSTDLRKVSVVYRESRFEVSSGSRRRGLLLGTREPEFALGKAGTVGILHIHHEKTLQPPEKWCYRKLAGWFAVISFVVLAGYAYLVISSFESASRLLVILYVLLPCCLFPFLGLLFWRHNQRVYPRQLREWEQSFVCQRCGGVNAQESTGIDS